MSDGPVGGRQGGLSGVRSKGKLTGGLLPYRTSCWTVLNVAVLYGGVPTAGLRALAKGTSLAEWQGTAVSLHLPSKPPPTVRLGTRGAHSSRVRLSHLHLPCKPPPTVRQGSRPASWMLGSERLSSGSRSARPAMCAALRGRGVAGSCLGSSSRLTRSLGCTARRGLSSTAAGPLPAMSSCPALKPGFCGLGQATGSSAAAGTSSSAGGPAAHSRRAVVFSDSAAGPGSGAGATRLHQCLALQLPSMRSQRRPRSRNAAAPACAWKYVKPLTHTQAASKGMLVSIVQLHTTGTSYSGWTRLQRAAAQKAGHECGWALHRCRCFPSWRPAHLALCGFGRCRKPRNRLLL